MDLNNLVFEVARGSRRRPRRPTRRWRGASRPMYGAAGPAAAADERVHARRPVVVGAAGSRTARGRRRDARRRSGSRSGSRRSGSRSGRRSGPVPEEEEAYQEEDDDDADAEVVDEEEAAAATPDDEDERVLEVTFKIGETDPPRPRQDAAARTARRSARGRERRRPPPGRCREPRKHLARELSLNARCRPRQTKQETAKRRRAGRRAAVARRPHLHHHHNQAESPQDDAKKQSAARGRARSERRH